MAHLVDAPNNDSGDFVDKDVGVPGTLMQAKWHNMVQEEFQAVVEGAGLTLDDGNNAQLLEAIQALMVPEAAIYVGAGGGAPAFQNSFANVSGEGKAAYWKDAAGYVHLQGSVGVGNSGAVVFTLPVGYRPTAPIYVPNDTDADNISRVLIGVNGTVIVSKSAGGAVVRATLDGIKFRLGLTIHP